MLGRIVSTAPTESLWGTATTIGEQALDVLIEKIHEVKRARKVLSLVTSDLQGAFNEVHTKVLCGRLRQRLIPDDLTKWIKDFCSGRQGSIVVGKHCTTQRQIEHVGISQGSPLSPILFIFYKANLVGQRINRKEGSVGFVNDYTTWVTSNSEEEATAFLQATIMPKATRWAEESGVTFEADKTGFIHFTRGQGDPYTPLRFGDVDIYPQPHVKILSLIHI